ncbi:hypothetical protein P170DRAFT_83918 [Aspergillus steynii IBT 23096]|uniref:Uncharacterized protein n=1 Tax=Aspergillus steynii IBT 23096 TaxID=1392250 RepID=A0A2I2GFQ8_9EURO|nr:uncharacterized protein P170DRAFT_83918 [Aspergillus steynii IBT 23096]PLB51713.1 hypothetical protein P170DRAFT_83918 [Aspergillus steynii IBT 23096]
MDLVVSAMSHDISFDVNRPDRVSAHPNHISDSRTTNSEVSLDLLDKLRSPTASPVKHSGSGWRCLRLDAQTHVYVCPRPTNKAPFLRLNLFFFSLILLIIIVLIINRAQGSTPRCCLTKPLCRCVHMRGSTGLDTSEYQATHGAYGDRRRKKIKRKKEKLPKITSDGGYQGSRTISPLLRQQRLTV